MIGHIQSLAVHHTDATVRVEVCFHRPGWLPKDAPEDVQRAYTSTASELLRPGHKVDLTLAPLGDETPRMPPGESVAWALLDKVLGQLRSARTMRDVRMIEQSLTRHRVAYEWGKR